MCSCALCLHRMRCEECIYSVCGDVIDTDPTRTVFGFIDNGNNAVVTLIVNNA